MVSRRVLLGLTISIYSFTALAGPGCDGLFAGKSMRWIVPNSTGGSYDTYSRIVGPRMAAVLGAKVQFENRPGAGGRIGANQIKRMRPDGLTLGIVSGTGLLALGLNNEPNTPDLSKDFTILGRVDRPYHIWAYGNSFKAKTLQALFASQNPSIVFGTPGPGSVSFISIALPAHLLGITPRFVSGYKNSRATKLAALRGEVEVVSHNFESTRKLFKKGELFPLLQLHDQPIADDKVLNGVPWLGGDSGLVLQRARKSISETEALTEDTNAVLALLGLGRLIVAPAGLDAKNSSCLREALMSALADSEVNAQLKKRGRNVDPASAHQVVQQIARVIARSAHLKPIIAAAIASVRR